MPPRVLTLTWSIKVDIFYPYWRPGGIQVDRKYPPIFLSSRTGNYWEGPSQAGHERNCLQKEDLVHKLLYSSPLWHFDPLSNNRL